MNEILKPCPFCKSEAHIEIIRKYLNKKKPRKCYYVIGCSDPECILFSDTNHTKTRLLFNTHGKEILIKRWNRRADNG